MEEIIKSITEAEQKAAEIKSEAALRAQKIIADAEKQAEEKRKYSQTELKAYRENGIKAATEAAQKAYDEQIERQSLNAKKYAAGLLKDTDFYVNDIVRRISGGSR